MAATGLHVLSAVGLRIGEKHKLSVGVVVALPRVSVSVTAFSSEQRSAKSFRDYLEAARDFIRPEENSPSRWFSPLESKARCDRAPLLLFLPGIDGNGLGLMRQHQKLGQMFDIWCLHIPPSNRTAFPDLVRMVETTVKSESQRSPGKPIYLVGESLGACIALAVAACNPHIDLVLILSNPATSFVNSSLQHLPPLLKVLPHQLDLAFPSVLSLIPGGPLKRMIAHWVRGLPENETAANIYQDLVTASTFTSILADTFGRETLLWKLKLLDSASLFANAHLHLVQAQTLILSSGNDHILPSTCEGKRLRRKLPKCEVRSFKDNGHCLFLEDGIDLVSIIKATSFYRRGRYQDYISDFIPPTISEFNKCYGVNRLLEVIMGPVFLSTTVDGKVVRGLGGIPSEGPVLLVGNHMLLASDKISLPGQFVHERNINLRPLVHPMMFTRMRDGLLPDVSGYDTLRMMGSVPISATHLHNLLSAKSHILLFPGGIREALHRKVVVDYNDQIKVPIVREVLKRVTAEGPEVRGSVEGEEGNQDFHMPGVIPKCPGRYYYYFGKEIETGEEELRDREKAKVVYAEVRKEVERCIEFVKQRREEDPYRPLLPRLHYHLKHGLLTQVPTFPF
ncbi:PREDICTED: acyltransferase-like protein At3g26840, chloroplastic isoform X2 [Brassica oleracea var. oleracea]|uniref:acyltransferase-like protein At3g26840, chloroplastic isoform X2 n=1 Tax=Brassica oleracea var. oleracea TaxID=109376 RepID=UPI0006A71C0F|nr:PREDICTED: acyltransferase-like protein At3g26840, chloroplastic isoform X2 [Brassica oleracea var. oleracea]